MARPACCARARGFTLFELMIAIAIAGILLGIGLPSFNKILHKTSARAISSELMGSINWARQEAVKRGETVTLCGTLDGKHCALTWHNQMLGFVDHNNNDIAEPDELIRVITHTRAKGWIRAKIDATSKFPKFNLDGSAVASGSFILCLPDNIAYSRQVVFNRPGRPYPVNMSHSGSTIFTNYGKAIDCTH